jgi:LuxR family maltose regulon positive regulatory protein
MAGEMPDAESWVRAAAPARPSRRAEAELDEALAVLEAITIRSGPQDMQEAASRASERMAVASPWASTCRFVAGVAAYLRADHEQARSSLEDAVALAGRGQATIPSLCLAQLAMAAIEDKDWDLASELTDRGRALLVEHGLQRDPLSALVFAASAAARARQGRSDEAKHDLHHGIELLTRLGDFLPWYGAETRILLAHASLWLADVVGARTLLAEASRLVRRVPEAAIFERWFDDAWEYIDTLAETSLSGPSSLTIAELRVLRFLPSHRSFREIAVQLGVSTNTVKTQAHAIYRKLDVASRSEAVARASQAGLLGQ